MNNNNKRPMGEQQPREKQGQSGSSFPKHGQSGQQKPYEQGKRSEHERERGYGRVEKSEDEE